MRIVAVCLAALAAGLCPLASGSAQQQAMLPPDLGVPDPEALGLWYRQYVTRDPKWHVRDYTVDGLIMTDRTARVGADGHVQTLIRVERTLMQTLDGFAWRSATLASDVDCNAPTVLTEYDQKTGKYEFIVDPPDAHRTTLTLYRGQNLTGESREIVAGDGAQLRGSMAAALRDACNLAIADWLDKGAESQGEPLTGRDATALRTWTANLETAGWEGLRADTAAATMHRTVSRRRGPQVRVQVRSELIEPALVFSRRRADEADRWSQSRKAMLRPEARPAWVRSTLEEYLVDCARQAVLSYGRKDFEMRNLQGLVNDGSIRRPKEWSTPPSSAYLWAHFTAACAT